MILSFTDSAMMHIKSILAKHPEDAMFRLSVKQTGCSGYMYMPEITREKKDADTSLSVGAMTVLIDSTCIPIIQGTVVDYIKKDFGMSALSFDNPNAEGLCGCGESFTLKNQSAS